MSTVSDKFYRAVWRWHFYAGLAVVPFFILLSVTGMAMLWLAHLDGRDGERIAVIPSGVPALVSEQAAAAVAAVPGGDLVQYIAPRDAERAAIFRIDAAGDAHMVVINPYTTEVLAKFPRRSGWYDFADALHGDIMLGVAGDRMLEIAASLGIILTVTGVYLWWPREGGLMRAFIPNFFASGRSWWKSLHATGGIWVSIILIFFLISGLAWAGVWGGKFVQAWSTFPAEKWDTVPLSDVTHASMNHDRHEVPWGLEQTPMPASGSDAGVAGTAPGEAVTMDTVDQLARRIGFGDRYQLTVPRGDTGVWTLSRDSMSTDSVDPTADRTTHVDQYTGKILADVRFEDYSWFAMFMAVGIALHMGTLGLWSVLANTAFCLMVIFLSVSGVVMWWKRRPSMTGRLVAPPMPKDMPLWKGAVAIGLVLSLAFPLAGVTLAVVLLLDFLLLSRVPVLKRVFS